MPYTGFMAAPLSDGRLQVWLSRQDGSLWTFWKADTDPDSAWTPWQRMPASQLGVRAGGATRLPNGALQLFVVANAGFNPPYQSGPGVETTWKVGGASTAAWAGWRVFWAGEQAVGGGPGARSIAAVPLTDGRIQVLFVVTGTNVSRLTTSWKATTDVNAAWSRFADFTPPGGFLRSIAVGRLSDGRPQLFATTDRDVQTTWKTSTDSNATWAPWQRFYAQADDDAISAASLPDGRLQLWRLNRRGAMWSRWKTGPNPNAPWTEWAPFSSGLGTRTLAFTAAPLSDGRLQLWAADESGAISTRWKASTHPDAAWTPWQNFPRP